MPQILKNLLYAGDATLLNEFPEFANVKIEFNVPSYQFSSFLTRGNRTIRQFAGMKSFTKFVQIKNTETNYFQKIPLNNITGNDLKLFGDLYSEILLIDPNNGNVTGDLDSFIKTFSFPFTTAINEKYSNNYTALPFILATGDLLSFAAGVSNQNMAMQQHPEKDKAALVINEALGKYFEQNLILLNADVFNRIRKSLGGVRDIALYLFTSYCFKVTNNQSTELLIPELVTLNEQIAKVIGIDNPEIAFNKLISAEEYTQLSRIIKENFDQLMDFPITIPEMKPVVVKGDIKFISQTNQEAKNIDLINYDLFIEYTENAHIYTLKYRWENLLDGLPLPENKKAFDFRLNNQLVLDANLVDDVKIILKLSDGTLLQARGLDAQDSDGMGNIHLIVELYKLPDSVSDNGFKIDNNNQQLKGKVLEASGKCALKDLSVIIQAKEKEADKIWRVVGAATTDGSGNFMMKYPFGVFEKAQAIVSLTPDSPVEITIFTDAEHKDAKQTISNDFLFLMVEKADCTPKDDATKKDDCGCHDQNKTPRLPNQEDLINSSEFSQDLGGGTCVNLTTPNRTLSETTHYAIVRTSEPDVANYVLEKSEVFDATDPANFNKNKITFILDGGHKIERQPVSISNPIRWQDAPDDHENISIYQAVQVAHGHLLTYKTTWKSDGYSLGDLLYSLPLAPGQKKQIVVYELKHALQGSESQQMSQGENLSASVTNDRSIIDQLGGKINQVMNGNSQASTSGMSAGLGAGINIGVFSAVLGVSGGFSNSDSSAHQDNARDTTQSFSEVLKNTISQNASSYRSLNATVVSTVSESQQFSTSTEVVANHNHCHSLTMLYFEVLRHYAVYQELSQVQECLFVPLLMTNFSTENIYKWRDILAGSLLPRRSNTYLPSYFGDNPLVKAFDAINRLKTDYQFVDFPANTYDDEIIREIIGEMDVRINLERPVSRYDRIKSWPLELVQQNNSSSFWTAVGAVLAGPIGAIAGSIFDSNGNVRLEVKTIIDKYIKINGNYINVPPAQSIRVIFFDDQFFENDDTSRQAWTGYANLLGKPSPIALLNEFFHDQLISDWDTIFFKEIAPRLVKKLADNITLSPLNVDFTAQNNYKGGEQIVRFNFRGTFNSNRKNISQVMLKMNSSQTIASDLTTIIVQNLSIRYTTNNYNGTIFSGYLGDDLSTNDPVIKSTPENADEKRNPRKEDVFIVNELITHLNSNLEYYNKILWYNLDQDRRYLLLDGFNIEVYNDLLGGVVNKSLASVVKNELIGIAGNSLIFPVAAGVRLDRNNIIIQAQQNGNAAIKQSQLNLFEHYKPLTPYQPYRISVPTKGVFTEAVKGSCDACEKVEDNTSQDWDKFKTDEPTAINPVTIPTPTITDWKAAFKDFAQPIVNIQNAPAAPAPGAGLAGLSDLLGKSNIFNDITGLDANQKNAMQTYLSNQENAKAFAEMAKTMSMQSHNTQNADKIQGAINSAKDSGAISKDDADKLTKDHLQQMIDGGDGKKAEQSSNAKPTLTDAAVKAAEQGKAVKATTTDAGSGKSESVDIGPKDGKLKYDFIVPGIFQPMQQTGDLCWAFTSTMMVNWKNQQSQTVENVVALAGADYTALFVAGQGLKVDKISDYASKIGMTTAASNSNFQISFLYDLLQKNGPVWIVDLEGANTDMLHGRMLIGIKGNDDGVDTTFTIIDPAIGAPNTEDYKTFRTKYEATANKVLAKFKDASVPQVIYFKDSYDQNKFGVNESGGVAVGGGEAVYAKTKEGAKKYISDKINGGFNYRDTAWVFINGKDTTSLDFQVVADRLQVLIDDPNKLNQGFQGTCGFATMLNIIIEQFPLDFAKFSVSLFKTGKGNLGSLEVAPSSRLVKADAQGILKRHMNNMEQADWMLLSSMQDINNIFAFLGENNSDVWFSSNTGAANEERVSLYKQTGYFKTVNLIKIGEFMVKEDANGNVIQDKNGKNITVIKKIVKGPDMGIIVPNLTTFVDLGIDAQLIKPNIPLTIPSASDRLHSVRMISRLKQSTLFKDKFTFDYFSWGGFHSESNNVETLITTFSNQEISANILEAIILEKK